MPLDRATMLNATGTSAAAQGCKELRDVFETLRDVNKRLDQATHDVYGILYISHLIYEGHIKRPSLNLARYKENCLKLSPSGVFSNDVINEWLKQGRAEGNVQIPAKKAAMEREFIDRELVMTNLEHSQSAIRLRFNNLARPHLRCLKILDFPNEVLLIILEYVEGYEGDASPSQTSNWNSCRKDIQNARLVCRKFRDLGSLLLVRIVDVELNQASVDRLNEISQHPSVSKGVRVVKVILDQYNDMLIDFETFLSFHAGQLENQVRLFIGDDPERRTSETATSAMSIVSTLRQRIDDLYVATDAGRVEDDRGWLSSLGSAHKKLLALVNKQSSLMEPRAFPRVVGAAIARMPFSRTLEFRDSSCGYPSRRQSINFEDRDIWGQVYRLMLEPITGADATAQGISSTQNYRCIFELIAAAQITGVLFRTIDITVWNPGCQGGLSVPHEDRGAFSAGMKQLKKFSFRIGIGPDDDHIDDVQEFLSACLDTPSLEHLELVTVMDPRRILDTMRIDAGQVMSSTLRPNLTALILHNVGLDLSDIVALKKIQKFPRHVDLENIRLYSGTWEEALDVLRDVRPRSINLRGLRGGERRDIPKRFYRKIFGESTDETGGESVAERYVLYGYLFRDLQGLDMLVWSCNPLMCLREG